MVFLEGVIAWVVQINMGIIQAIGLPGIFGLMTLESMCLPIPSEIVLPFGGALVAQGRIALTGDPILDTFLVAVAGTVGCAAGSVVAYYAGMKGGRPLVLRYGRYVRLNEKHLELSERWFEKYGSWVVFGSRLLPVVRTFASIPAGAANMRLDKFVLLTTAGSFPWCLALAYVGYFMGENWEAVEALYRPLEMAVVIGAVAYAAFYLWRRWSKKNLCSPEPPQVE